MKIQKEHYDFMKNAIASISKQAKAERELVAQSKTSLDKEKLFRWNMSYQAGLTKYICENVYEYANDDHIDTALRNIIKELEI